MTNQLSKLGKQISVFRSFSLRNSNHITLLAIVLAASSISFFITSPSNVIAAGLVALVVIVTWLIGREIDPDQNATAILASIISIFILLTGVPANTQLLAELIIVVLCLRIISGCTGKITGPVEVMVLAIITTAVALIQHNLVVLIIWVMFNLLNRLVNKQHFPDWLLGITPLMFLIVIINDGGKMGFSGYVNFTTVLVLILAFGRSLLRHKQIKSKRDSGDTFEWQRLLTARLFFLFTVIILQLVYFPSQTIPAWSALLAFILTGSNLLQFSNDHSTTEA